MKKKSDKTSNRIKKSFTIVVFHNQENKRMSIQEYIQIRNQYLKFKKLKYFRNSSIANYIDKIEICSFIKIQLRINSRYCEM